MSGFPGAIDADRETVSADDRGVTLPELLSVHHPCERLERVAGQKALQPLLFPRRGRFDSLLVEPGSTRQLFNDTEADQLWLAVGAPPEAANTLEMTEELLRQIYPDGPKALPPELDG